MSKQNREPAFPMPEQRAFDGAGLVEGHPGMSLRYWTAVKVYAALLSNTQVADDFDIARSADGLERLAVFAYVAADVMIAEMDEE